MRAHHGAHAVLVGAAGMNIVESSDHLDGHSLVEGCRDAHGMVGGEGRRRPAVAKVRVTHYVLEVGVCTKSNEVAEPRRESAI